MKRVVVECDGCGPLGVEPFTAFPLRVGELDLCSACVANERIAKLLKLAQEAETRSKQLASKELLQRCAGVAGRGYG